MIFQNSLEQARGINFITISFTQLSLIEQIYVMTRLVTHMDI